MSWPPRLKAWWQVNFGPKGTFYDGQLPAIYKNPWWWVFWAISFVTLYYTRLWLRSEGLSWLAAWIVSVGGFLALAWLLSAVLSFVRRRSRTRVVP